MADPLLGIYLNDHLVDATGGLELFRRAAASQQSRSGGSALARLRDEVAQCRVELLALMDGMGIPQRRWKVAGGWLGRRSAGSSSTVT